MTKFKIPGRDCVGCSDSGGELEFQDEGTSIGTANTVDFVGDAVQATKSGGKVTVTVSGGGSGSALVNWPIASGAPSGAIPQGKRYYLTGAEGTILGETVSEGTVMEARIANPAVRADWYFNFGGT